MSLLVPFHNVCSSRTEIVLRFDTDLKSFLAVKISRTIERAPRGVGEDERNK